MASKMERINGIGYSRREMSIITDRTGWCGASVISIWSKRSPTVLPLTTPCSTICEKLSQARSAPKGVCAITVAPPLLVTWMVYVWMVRECEGAVGKGLHIDLFTIICQLVQRAEQSPRILIDGN